MRHAPSCWTCSPPACSCTCRLSSPTSAPQEAQSLLSFPLTTALHESCASRHPPALLAAFSTSSSFIDSFSSNFLCCGGLLFLMTTVGHRQRATTPEEPWHKNPLSSYCLPSVPPTASSTLTLAPHPHLAYAPPSWLSLGKLCGFTLTLSVVLAPTRLMKPRFCLGKSSADSPLGLLS